MSQLKKKKVASEQALRAALTPLAVPAVVAPAVVKVAEAAVPGQRVHDAGRADGVHERGLTICCRQKH